MTYGGEARDDDAVTWLGLGLGLGLVLGLDAVLGLGPGLGLGLGSGLKTMAPLPSGHAKRRSLSRQAK